jgi:hypothetical protein
MGERRKHEQEWQPGWSLRDPGRDVVVNGPPLPDEPLVPKSRALAAEREVRRLTGLLTEPGTIGLERLRRERAEQSLREAEGCVHSKAEEGCAGCEVRNLRRQLASPEGGDVTEYIIFHRTGSEPFAEVGRTFAETGHGAVEAWLADENDECPLAACDVAAVANWAFYRDHYEPRI